MNTYKTIYLQVTPLYVGKNIQNIELPRNTYLDFKISQQNIPLIFSISRPNKVYNFSKIELSYNSHGNYSLIMKPNNIYLPKDNSSFGKAIYYINDKQINHNIAFKVDSFSNDGHIFIKHSLQKNNKTKFYLNNYNKEDIVLKAYDEKKNNSFFIEYYNIKTDDDNFTDYKINYIIRLYDYLDHYYDEEINNINRGVNLINSFRKELNKSELKKEKIQHNLDFNFGKDYGEFTVSILGEVLYNDNVEYFSYNYKTFPLKNPKIIEFDEAWIAPLIIVLIILITIFIYLIIQFIKNKKKKNNEDENKNGNEDQGKFVNNSIGENQNV